MLAMHSYPFAKEKSFTAILDNLLYNLTKEKSN
jgi:hypothetical protein